jgi:hypothetical protein
MKRRMILKFCPDEFKESGVPLVLLAYSDEVDSGPYIDCTVLVAYSAPELGLDKSTVEFLNALMSDLQQASTESREAALLILKRLEAIQFGPIRCLPA